jgi:hypothetical protein
MFICSLNSKHARQSSFFTSSVVSSTDEAHLRKVLDWCAGSFPAKTLNHATSGVRTAEDEVPRPAEPWNGQSLNLLSEACPS